MWCLCCCVGQLMNDSLTLRHIKLDSLSCMRNAVRYDACWHGHCQNTDSTEVGAHAHSLSVVKFDLKPTSKLTRAPIPPVALSHARTKDPPGNSCTGTTQYRGRGGDRRDEHKYGYSSMGRGRRVPHSPRKAALQICYKLQNGPSAYLSRANCPPWQTSTPGACNFYHGERSSASRLSSGVRRCPAISLRSIPSLTEAIRYAVGGE